MKDAKNMIGAMEHFVKSKRILISFSFMSCRTDDGINDVIVEEVDLCDRAFVKTVGRSGI